MSKNPNARRRTSSNLEFGGTFEMDWRAGEFADMAWRAAQGVLREAVDRVVEQAKENVSPGKGPKEHTTAREQMGIHTGTIHSYVDTGKLRDSITSSVSEKSGHLIASVWSDTAKTDGIPYGMYLELGFHPTDPFFLNRRYGSFYRYPWLGPAFLKVAEEYKGMIPGRFRHHLHDAVARGKKKQSLKIIRPITKITNIAIEFKRGTRQMLDRLEDLQAYGHDNQPDVDTSLLKERLENRKRP